MSRTVAIPLFASLMVLVVVGVDILVFRAHPWERLMANVGIVLVFGAFFLRFWPLAPNTMR